MSQTHDGCEVEVRVPDDVGAPTISEIRVCLWLCGLGQQVREGQRMIELIIGPMTYVIHSPCCGRLAKKCVAEEALVKPGSLLGVIETDGRDTPSQP